jgi:Flp pilus assembly pilin Flp
MCKAHAMRLWRDQEGVSLIEYGLVAALVAVLCTAAITVLGGRTLDMYMLVCNGVALATGNPPC